MKPILEIKGLGKKYKVGQRREGYQSLREQLFSSFHSTKQTDSFWALKDINIEVAEGECLGVIGRNGAGKSTLLKIISRITPPTEGYVKTYGRIASLLEVGTGFHLELNGRENIYLNGSILGLHREEIRAKFDEIVEFSGVARFLETPLKHYSSGMQLRLAFAVAAHLEPEILLIDEVLAVGDVNFQRKCLNKMDEVSKNGRTIIFVSHNLGMMNRICSSGVQLEKGKVNYKGDIQSTIDHYLKHSDHHKAQKDLHVREDRRGDGRVRLSKITILDQEDQPLLNDTTKSGDTIKFVIHYQSINYPHQKIKDLRMGIAILNQGGQFMTPLNNEMSDFKFNHSPKDGEIWCIVNKLPLIEGNYTGTLTLMVDYLVADQIEEAFTLQVNQGDYYESGFPNSYKRSGVYIDQEWFIK